MEKLDNATQSDNAEKNEYDLVMKHVIQDDPELFYLDSYLLGLFSTQERMEIKLKVETV